MNNGDRYLTKRPAKLPRKARVDADDDLSSLYFITGGACLIMSAAIFTLAATGVVQNPGEMWFLGGLFTVCALLGLGMGLSGLSFKPEVPEKEFGHDRQARGLYDRIRAVAKYSTAGWDDDLWQAFFAIGQLLDEKKALHSVTLAQELHDEIDVLVGELDEMITARKALVDQRRRLGLELTVPGTEAQRIASGAAEEMEELAMGQLLRRRVAEIRSAGRRVLERELTPQGRTGD